MSNFETEEQQVEALKKWWKQNGKAVMIGGVLGIAAVIAGRGYMDRLEAQGYAASTAFDQMTQAMQVEQADFAASLGEQIVTNHSDTPYAAMASLALAALHVEKGELDAAQNRLQWVLDHADQQDIIHTARLRLAEVLLANGKYDIALSKVTNINMDGYTSLYQELIGDIYLGKQQLEKARDAYNAALEALDTGDNRQNLQMKLDDLGV